MGDLTEEDAKKLLARKIGSNSWTLAPWLHCLLSVLQAPCLSWRACSGGLNALELVDACQRYAADGEEALQAKKAEMEERACEDEETFLRDCKFKTVDDITPAGLKALLQNRAGGGAVGKLEGGSGALPKGVAKWIRERNAHAVIWRIREEKYQFASELHADIAASFQKQIDGLSS